MMNKLVIQVTLGKANPNRANGVNAAVHGLSVALAEAGRPIEVWGITPTPEAPTFERSYPLRLFKRKAHRLWLDPALKAAIAALPKGTLVHFHGGLLPEFYLIARELHRRGIEWILTPHGAYSPTALKKGALKKRLFMALFDSFVIRHASRIHGLAEASTAGLSATLAQPKTVVVPNGYAASTEQPAELKSAPFRFAFCGRLDTHTKGLDLLVEAFTMTSSKLPTAHLDIIGDGADRPALEERACAQVRFPGALFGEDKQRALREADCFVLTSRHEGFPMSLAEAASLGLPLVVSEGTNFADYVRNWDCGLVVPALTVEAIADTLLEMATATPERRRQMGANAVRLIEEELSWKHIAERIQAELYDLTLESVR